MNDSLQISPTAFSIAAVERDCGLTKDTLRIWERRYGFPRPGRDGYGERVYPAEQVDKLRLIKRLIDQGHRPGKIIGLATDELQRLAGGPTRAAIALRASAGESDPLAPFLACVKSHALDALRDGLAQALLRLGLARFVDEVVAPLNERVGEAWARGEFEVYEEHLYTESIQGVLRNAIRAIPQPAGETRRPLVLLTTLPQEPHGIGLLMAEAIFALEGARCVALGVQTPLWDIVQAAAAQRVDVVGLSFSACLGPNQVFGSLAELRGKLDAAVEIWAGGACAALHRRPPPGVRCFRSLDGIAPALAEWRAARAG